jgi:lactoylglutathione lyase
LKELSAPDSAARFFFVTDPDGYKIEVLQRAGHYV